MNRLRLSGSVSRRHVLGRHDRALDHEDVELGLERELVVALDLLRRQRRGGGDAGVLDLADALVDQLFLDGLLIDLLHAPRRLVVGQLRDLGEDRIRVLVAGLKALEVEHRKPAEPADLDRRSGATRPRPSPRP